MSSYNFAKWGIYHKKIAEKYLKNNHPPDSVMAIIYGMITFKVKKGSEWF